MGAVDTGWGRVVERSIAVDTGWGRVAEQLGAVDTGWGRVAEQLGAVESLLLPVGTDEGIRDQQHIFRNRLRCPLFCSLCIAHIARGTCKSHKCKGKTLQATAGKWWGWQLLRSLSFRSPRTPLLLHGH